MTITELIAAYNNWMTTGCVQNRLNNNGYAWAYSYLNYVSDTSLTSYQEFFDRTEQNNEYLKRYNQTDLSQRKPYAWIQTEINAIAGFHKCFAMRYQSRLQFYRSDMSQKGARTLSTINQALGTLLYNQDLAS